MGWNILTGQSQVKIICGNFGQYYCMNLFVKALVLYNLVQSDYAVTEGNMCCPCVLSFRRAGGNHKY